MGKGGLKKFWHRVLGGKKARRAATAEKDPGSTTSATPGVGGPAPAETQPGGTAGVALQPPVHVPVHLHAGSVQTKPASHHQAAAAASHSPACVSSPVATWLLPQPQQVAYPAASTSPSRLSVSCMASKQATACTCPTGSGDDSSRAHGSSCSSRQASLSQASCETTNVIDGSCPLTGPLPPACGFGEHRRLGPHGTAFDFGLPPCKVEGDSFHGSMSASTPTCVLPACFAELQPSIVMDLCQESTASLAQCSSVSLAPAPVQEQQLSGQQADAPAALAVHPCWPQVLLPPATGLERHTSRQPRLSAGLQQPQQQQHSCGALAAPAAHGPACDSRQQVQGEGCTKALVALPPLPGLSSTGADNQHQASACTQQQFGDGLQQKASAGSITAPSTQASQPPQLQRQSMHRHHPSGPLSSSSIQSGTIIKAPAATSTSSSKPPRLRSRKPSAGSHHQHHASLPSPGTTPPKGPSLPHSPATTAAAAPVPALRSATATPRRHPHTPSSPEIHMMWPLCLTSQQGAGFLAAKVSGGKSRSSSGHNSGELQPGRGGSSAPSQSSGMRVNIVMDGTPLAVLTWDEALGVVGGLVSSSPALLSGSGSLQVASAYATHNTQGGSCAAAAPAERTGPAVSLLCVPAQVAQELHLLFALWVDAQLSDHTAQAIHEGTSQYPSLTELHGLAPGQHHCPSKQDSGRLSTPACQSSPCAIPSTTAATTAAGSRVQSPTSTAICRAGLLDGLFALREQRSFSHLHSKPSLEHVAVAAATAQPFQRSRTSHLPIIPQPRKPSWLMSTEQAAVSPGSTPHTSQSFNVWDAQHGSAAVTHTRIGLSQSLPASQPSFGVHGLCTTPTSALPPRMALSNPTDSVRLPSHQASSSSMMAHSSEQDLGRLAQGGACPPPWLLSPELSRAACMVWNKQWLPLARDIAYLIMCVPSVFDHQRLSLYGEVDVGPDVLSKTWDRKTYCAALARILLLLETHHMWQTLAMLMTHAGEHGVHIKCRGERLQPQGLSASGLQQLLQSALHEDITIGYDGSAAGGGHLDSQATTNNSTPLTQLSLGGHASAEAKPSARRPNKTTSDAPCVGDGPGTWRTGAQAVQALAPASRGVVPSTRLSRHSTGCRQRRASLPLIMTSSSSAHCESAPCALSLHHTRSSTGVPRLPSSPTSEFPTLHTIQLGGASEAGVTPTTSDTATYQAYFAGSAARTCAGGPPVPLPLAAFGSMSLARHATSDAHGPVTSTSTGAAVTPPVAREGSRALMGWPSLDADDSDARWGQMDYLDQPSCECERGSSGGIPTGRGPSWPGPAPACLQPSATHSMSQSVGYASVHASAAPALLETVMSSGAEQWMQLLASTTSTTPHGPNMWHVQQEQGSAPLESGWGSGDWHPRASPHAAVTHNGGLRTTFAMLTSTAGAVLRPRSTNGVSATTDSSPSTSQSQQLLQRVRGFPAALCSMLSAACSSDAHTADGCGKTAYAGTSVAGPSHSMSAVLLSPGFLHLHDVDPWWWHVRVLVEQLVLILLCMVLVLCMYL